MDIKCEYKRCGGKGHRETSEKMRRIARDVVVLDGEMIRVCESCADLITRDLRLQGHDTRRVRSGPENRGQLRGEKNTNGPQAISDILRKITD